MTPMSHHLDCQQTQLFLLLLLEQSHPEKWKNLQNVWRSVTMKQGDDSTSDLKGARFGCLFCEDGMGCGHGSLYFFGVWPGSRKCWEESITSPQNHRLGILQDGLWLHQGICLKIPKCPFIEVYSRIYSSLPRCVCVCVLGEFFQGFFIAAHVQRCKDKCMCWCIFICVCIGKI